MAESVIELSPKNLKAIQQTMRETIQKLEPKGSMSAVAFATLGIHRWMTTPNHTHYDTGRLRNSLFPEINGQTGRIFTNVVYAPYEEARGGTHAFMTRAETEGAPKIAEKTLEIYGAEIQSTWEQTA